MSEKKKRGKPQKQKKPSPIDGWVDYDDIPPKYWKVIANKIGGMSAIKAALQGKIVIGTAEKNRQLFKSTGLFHSET